MAPGEYYPIKLAARFHDSGKEILAELREGDRKFHVTLPTDPLVGEVTGLAVAGEQGILLRFEMQVSRGNGRIVPLGSIQRVMRESIEAAAQYIRAHYKDLEISSAWRENMNVAVLATMMGVPKEGPSYRVATPSPPEQDGPSRLSPYLGGWPRRSRGCHHLSLRQRRRARSHSV